MPYFVHTSSARAGNAGHGAWTRAVPEHAVLANPCTAPEHKLVK